MICLAGMARQDGHRCGTPGPPRPPKIELSEIPPIPPNLEITNRGHRDFQDRLGRVVYGSDPLLVVQFSGGSDFGPAIGDPPMTHP